MSLIPTIIIGVGGTGARIVERVYQNLPKDKRDQFSFFVLDTDINTLDELSIPRDHLIQTSRALTIEQYVQSLADPVRENVEKWMVKSSELPIFCKERGMTDGAGQVRMISRLGMRAAVESGQLGKFDGELQRITELHGTGMQSGYRIGIVGSLAGGTGSGNFLQVALYMKKLFKSRGIESLIIKGYFLMPSPYITTSTITRPGDQRNVQSNAFASIKEYCATLQNKGEDASRHTLELDVDPGKDATALEPGNVPYNYMLLFEDTTKQGNSLRSLKSYEKMIADVVYLDLLSPMSAKGFSVLDNLVVDLIGEGYLNRFGSAGSSTLEYPYQRVIDFFAIKSTDVLLGSKWLAPDDKFKEAMQRFKKNKYSGNDLPKPTKSKEYRNYIDLQLSSSNPDPFFSEIYAQLFMEDDEGKILKDRPKAIGFLSSIMKKLESLVEASDGFATIADRIQFSQESLTEDNVLNTIANIEAELDKLEKTGRGISANYSGFYRQCYDVDLRKRPKGYDDAIPYSLNSWILSNNGMHPMAARYFLYEVEQAINDFLLVKRDDVADLEQSINEYDKQFQTKTEDGDSVGVGPQELASQILDKRKLLFFKDKKALEEFGRSYKLKALKQKEAVQDYLLLKMQYDCFTGLHRVIKRFIEIYEWYFTTLEQVDDELDLRMSRIRDEVIPRSNRDGGNIVYTLGDYKLLNKLYDEVQKEVDIEEMAQETKTAYYLARYKELLEYLDTDRLPHQNLSRKESQNMLELTVKGLLEPARQGFEENKALDLDIIQALSLEAKLLQEDPAEYTRNQIQQLEQRGVNFGPATVPAKRDNSTTFIGCNRSFCAQYMEANLPDIFTNAKTKPQLIDNDGFDKRKIYYCSYAYGLLIEDFPKFKTELDSGGPGPYYTNYQERIRNLYADPDRNISPHIDKRWHLPSFLPELNPKLEQHREKLFLEGIAKGIALKSISQIEKDRKVSWSYKGALLKDHEGNLIQGASTRDLIRCLNENPILISDIHEDWKLQLEADLEKHGKDWKSYQTIKGIKQPALIKDQDHNLLDIIVSYFNDNKYRSEQLQFGGRMYASFIAVLKEIVGNAVGNDNKNTIKEDVENLLKRSLKAGADEYKQLSANGTELLSLLAIEKEQGLDT